MVKLVDALGVGRKRELKPNMMANIVIVKTEPFNLQMEEDAEIYETEEPEESCHPFLEESDEEEMKPNKKKQIPQKIARTQDNIDYQNVKHVYNTDIKVKHEKEDSVKRDCKELEDDQIKHTKCSHCPKTFTRKTKLEVSSRI